MLLMAYTYYICLRSTDLAFPLSTAYSADIFKKSRL